MEAHRLPGEPGEGVWVIAASRPREEAQQGAFAEALTKGIHELAGTTGRTQMYLSLDSLMA